MNQFFLQLYRRTLGSVVFGIVLMVLIALYIAIGSGAHVVREAFEMNEMQFFNAWPLTLLSVLLILNLMFVTVERIPFTPPRYGVWMIHIGVVVLIWGMMFYYKYKTEGLTLIPVGQSKSHYYDLHERALFMRLQTTQGLFQVTSANNRSFNSHPLPSLPRFKVHDPELAPTDRLEQDDLRGIVPVLYTTDPATGQRVPSPIARELGMPGDLKIDIVAYYPYARIETRAQPNPDIQVPAVQLLIRDPHGDETAERWVTAGDPAKHACTTPMGVVEHRHVTDDALPVLMGAASRLHKLEVKIGDHTETMHVELGQSYPIGQTGYTITVESFDPAFPPFDPELKAQRPMVELLTVMVQSPTQTFRRQMISDWEKPTDWKLDEPGAGPMGKRQKEPLDTQLVTRYTFDDPQHLLEHGSASWIIATTPTQTAVIAIPADKPASVSLVPPGETAEFTIGGTQGVPLPVTAQRHEQVEVVDAIIPVPPEHRRRDEAGINQVIRARVHLGDWSKEVAVPFSQWPLEGSWQGGEVDLAGTPYRLQLQLGNTCLPMPARVTLEKFELVNYMGGTPQTTNLFRDFKSTLTIVELENGRTRQGVAHMNNPVYFGGIGDSEWTLFQAQFDKEQRWTVLGVGNRPGVWIMTAGCVLITVGLLYAFYLKPIIIRKMKEKALREAAQRAAARGAVGVVPAEPVGT